MIIMGQLSNFSPGHIEIHLWFPTTKHFWWLRYQFMANTIPVHLLIWVIKPLSLKKKGELLSMGEKPEV